MTLRKYWKRYGKDVSIALLVPMLAFIYGFMLCFVWVKLNYLG